MRRAVMCINVEDVTARERQLYRRVERELDVLVMNTGLAMTREIGWLATMKDIERALGMVGAILLADYDWKWIDGRVRDGRPLPISAES
jgi:hypothetical protein